MPPVLPPLPPTAQQPWSAHIIEAHRGLVSAFTSSQKALNLDESDPIHLGHHLKQAETFMSSIVDALDQQTDSPLPDDYIQSVRDSVELLIKGLQVAHKEATSAYVLFSWVK